MFSLLSPAQRRQRGAVAVIAAIALPILIGFAGLALDGGRLYMQKTELQNAADACALAASRELTCDPSAGACAASFLINAENAGLAVAGRNRIDFQGSPLGSAQLTAADITFSTTYGPASSYLSRAAGASPAAKYVRCQPRQTGVLPWFMQVLGVGAQSINADAVASLSPAQTNCAIPIGVCMTATGTSSNPFAGLTVGQWVTSKLSSSATGSFDWIDFTPPGGGASELGDLLKGTGQCSTSSSSNVGEQGNKASLAKAWNTRFGLYQGSDSVTTATPDYTGFAYTATSWPSKFNAYGGTSGSTSNFLAARTLFKPYQGDSASGINIIGNPAVSSAAQHQQYGADRRLVTAPVVNCAAWAGGTGSQQVPVLGYACVLMLHPMGKDDDEVFLEYRGKSTDLSSACATSGAVGGPSSMGPLVPALVQ
ncbi:hypothetical protein ASD15_16330 [Massilia sp. Root351]|jgi:hypothetical protein|uniref:pilus assembly protein TadG-related protein n=1 Tax=Massilia sp. Root351 TaxID=1736522 RepID=UPI00070E7F78|nr:pilus assembly protein TadG-related protein [Massilia sp. Root351]KQV80413.1 hypothetical protein ASD15_16330 [Massilia sp. Root351]